MNRMANSHLSLWIATNSWNLKPMPLPLRDTVILLLRRLQCRSRHMSLDDSRHTSVDHSRIHHLAGLRRRWSKLRSQTKVHRNSEDGRMKALTTTRTVMTAAVAAAAVKRKNTIYPAWIPRRPVMLHLPTDELHPLHIYAIPTVYRGAMHHGCTIRRMLIPQAAAAAAAVQALRHHLLRLHHLLRHHR